MKLIVILTETNKSEWKKARIIEPRCADPAKPNAEPTDSTIKLFLLDYLLIFIREDIQNLPSLTRETIERCRQSEIYLAVHRLRGFIENSDDRESLRQIVDVLVNFHHDDDVPGYKRLTDALGGVLQSIEGGDNSRATSARCLELTNAIIDLSRGTQIKRISVLKHQIANCFLPIDIDLQGWKDTGFNTDYGKEIVAAYKGNSSTPLQQAREHLYEGTYSLGGIIEDTSDKEVDSAREQVECLLPESEWAPSDESFQRASSILSELYAGNLEKVKEMLGALSDPDPFHTWFEKLMVRLDKLRDAMEVPERES